MKILPSRVINSPFLSRSKIAYSQRRKFDPENEINYLFSNKVDTIQLRGVKCKNTVKLRSLEPDWRKERTTGTLRQVKRPTKDILERRKSGGFGEGGNKIEYEEAKEIICNQRRDCKD